MSSDYTLGQWSLPEESSDPYNVRTPRTGSISAPTALRKIHRGPVYCIKVMESNRYCTSGSDGVLKIWAETALQAVLKAQKAVVHCLMYSYSHQLMGGGSNGQVFRWDAETQQLLNPVPHHEHQKRVTCISEYNPQTYLSASSDSTVKLWDIRAQRSIVTFSGHADAVSAVMPCIDQGFYSASDQESIYRWECAHESDFQISQSLRSSEVTRDCLWEADERR